MALGGAGWRWVEAGVMNEDMAYLDERLTGEYAALRDTPAVMRSAEKYLDELRGAGNRLGDAIEQGGFPGKLWRSDEANIATLGDIFPLITVDELITRLAQFAAERGPAWLHGDTTDLAAFRDEARILYDVTHALRVTAQRLRMTGASGKSQLERVLSNARIAAPLDRVAILLETLDALGPFMASISPDAWAASATMGDDARQSDDARQGFAAFGASSEQEEFLSASAARGRLRDYGLSGSAGGSRLAGPRAGGRSRGKVTRLLRNRWMLGIAGAVIIGALVAFLLVRPPALPGAKKAPTTTPAPAVVATPTTLVLLCSTRKTAALTLKNQSAAPVTWQAKAPATVALNLTQGTIPAGQSVTLQAHLTAAKATTGAITITIGKTTLTVPFSATC
jgi:hypothetical protein